MRARLAWVEWTTIVYACRHWHYAGQVPAGRLMGLGVWEGERFVGVIVFGRGSTPNIGKPYGLEQGAVCELVRVALRDHVTPVSRMLAVGMKLLKRRCPGLRLIISYAAAEEGHYGGIYQAGGWFYEGPMDSHRFEVRGKIVHPRSLGSKYGRHDIEFLRKMVDPDVRVLRGLVRHKYLMPLDAGMQLVAEGKAKPYPKKSELRAKQAMAGTTGTAAV